MTSDKRRVQLVAPWSSKNGNSSSLIPLIESELRYRRLFEAAQDGILILNANTGAIVDVNPFLIQLLGYSREEFLGKKLWEIGAFIDRQASEDAFLRLQKDEYIRYKDLPLRSKDGLLIQVEFVSNVYWAGSDKVIQCNIRDITKRKKSQDALIRSEARFREKSVRDHLTGLFNRRYMEETLARELRRARRKQLPLGLIMCDLDDLKYLNDTWGHAAGDLALRKLGKFLRQFIREEDIACRYGGDEFIIVLPEANLDVTFERAQFICNHVKDIDIEWEGKHLGGIALSIGVATFPDDGLTRTAILQSVDSALYRAKNEGRDRVVKFAPSPE